MEKTITISLKRRLAGTLYRVKQYAEMLDMYDLADIQGDKPMESRSNFGYVQVWTPGLGTGSVSIYTVLKRADIERLKGMQYAQENVSVDQKMNFLVYSGNYVRPCWTGDESLSWRDAPEVRVGACVYTNQLVMVDRIETLKVKFPNQGYDAFMRMGRLVCFKSTDWDKSFATTPYKVHHVTGVRQDNIHNEFPFGEVFLPLFDPLDFDIHPVANNPEFRREYWAYMDTLKAP